MAGMVVQHNMNALTAYNKLNTNVAGLKKSSEKLASGYRINRAGDDAAGLAISEKMRSQIRGLNQAKRNSQDGISMIQTFEGALQESHSILQRMKELASESANGTYQNEVDRDAIQLEFNQLNDELNQIADTDFNGVTMLNGGQMADGAKAVNGKYDYENGPKAPTQLGKNDVTVVDGQKWDDVATGVKAADTAWKALNAAWTRTAGQPDTYGPDSVDVTFKYNETDGTWSVTEASNGADKSKVTTEKTENGGFAVKIGGVELTDVIIDQSKLSNGDTITLKFNNPAQGTDAPTNIGATMTDSSSFTVGTVAGAKVENANLTTVIDATNVTDANMTEDINALFDKLNGASLDVLYGMNAGAADGKVDKLTLTLSDGTTLGMDAKADSTTSLAVGDSTFTLAVTKDTGKLEIKDAAGNALVTITPHDQTTDKGSGTLSYKLGIESPKYDATAIPSVEVAATGNVSRSDSYGSATAPLTYTDHLTLQTGARTKDSVDFSFEYTTDGMGDLKANMNVSARADGLGTAGLSLNTQEAANAAIDKIDNAINKVSMVRATFGATQNRLEHKIENLTTTAENLTEAESTIRDTDMASEMMSYTKFNILQQAAQSMLAQANQQPQSILQLLG